MNIISRAGWLEEGNADGMTRRVRIGHGKGGENVKIIIEAELKEIAAVLSAAVQRQESNDPKQMLLHAFRECKQKIIEDLEAKSQSLGEKAHVEVRHGI